MKHFILVLTICLLPATAHSFCFVQAGQRYGIDAQLLQAVAQTESSLRPNIESRTQDIGLMGINRSWLPILRKRFGLTEADVWNPCTNVMVGAWILANEFATKGRNWNAVGAYNAACIKLKGMECAKARQKYTTKVWQTWQQLKSM
ncbi:lytic transglycosylase domain-containing protein [Hydromonas duriensis]|uniref:Transglycosylase-like protein with SLT domain n=1 Tax=Hydromonas duriensis TaxID=1527608 RepID=A0A4R6Y5E4_9BURK|nr:lytic transglycosylase domain-containing protein [Hydromonas duriensis]TDR30277.1 transglycosylase-like protein with SLT domain [Hydromonas duriensis]